MLETEYSFSPIGFLHSPLKDRGEAPGKAAKEPPPPLHGEVFREEAGSPVILSRREESLVGSHADSSRRLRMTGVELDGEKNLPVKAPDT